MIAKKYPVTSKIYMACMQPIFRKLTAPNTIFFLFGPIGTGKSTFLRAVFPNEEVDFVVYGPQTFYAIEVKNAGRTRNEDFRGLKSFADLYPQATRVLLYRGKESTLEQGVTCLPVEKFLRQLDPGKAISEVL